MVVQRGKVVAAVEHLPEPVKVRVSIIIPVYNDAEQLRQTLLNLYKQNLIRLK